MLRQQLGNGVENPDEGSSGGSGGTEGKLVGKGESFRCMRDEGGTSHASAQGRRVVPSGRLLFSSIRLTGSFTAGIWARLMALHMMSFM